MYQNLTDKNEENSTNSLHQPTVEFKSINVEQNFNCEYCSESFFEATKLKRHIYAVHEGQNDHRCDSCKKSFFDRKSLKHHIRSVHRGGR